MDGAQSSAPDDENHSESPCILVVDDDPSARGVAVAALESDGFDTVEAETGDQALRLMSANRFHAVLLDRTMPGIDGIEVLHWIRRTPSIATVPVILVTGRDEVADLVEGLGLGADDYVVKPYEPGELIARLRSHLRGRSVWATVLAHEVARRRALMEAAAATSTTASLELAALDLCDAIMSLPEASGATVVELAGDAVATIAAKGRDPLEVLLDQRDPRALARQLTSRAGSGAWFEPVFADAEVTTIAVAPIRTDDEVTGLLATAPTPGADSRDLDRLLAQTIDFATLAGVVLGEPLRDSSRRDAARNRFVELVQRHEFQTVFQPVVELATDRVLGYEALTRFDLPEPTEQVFLDAAAVGAGTAVELRTIEAAIAAARELPPEVWLGLNLSPGLVLDPALAEQLEPARDRTIVLELSELEPVADYELLRDAIARLGMSVQISVDDAGSGFNSLAHILALSAGYVKLDRSWVSSIGSSSAKRALVAGLVSFARETGATLIAEGIETDDELRTVRELGVPLGQGFLLGEPAAL